MTSGAAGARAAAGDSLPAASGRGASGQLKGGASWWASSGERGVSGKPPRLKRVEAGASQAQPLQLQVVPKNCPCLCSRVLACDTATATGSPGEKALGVACLGNA